MKRKAKIEKRETERINAEGTEEKKQGVRKRVKKNEEERCFASLSMTANEAVQGLMCDR